MKKSKKEKIPDGAIKSTCGEARILLNEGKIRQAIFRPGMSVVSQGGWSDSDLAYIWLE